MANISIQEQIFLWCGFRKKQYLFNLLWDDYFMSDLFFFVFFRSLFAFLWAVTVNRDIGNGGEREGNDMQQRSLAENHPNNFCNKLAL